MRFNAAFGAVRLVDGVLTTLSGEAVGANHEFVDRIGDVFGLKATVFVTVGDDYERVTTNVPQADGSRALGTKLGPASAAYPVVRRGERFLGSAKILGQPYLTVYDPIRDSEGQVVGILFLGISQSEIRATIDASSTQSLWVQGLVTLAILVGVLAVGSWFSKSLVVPLRVAAAKMKDLAEHDADLSQRLTVGKRDEVGRFTEDFNRFLDKLRDLVIKIRGALSASYQVKDRVAGAAEETALALHQLSASSASMDSQIENLDERVRANVDALRSMSAGVEAMDRQVVDQSAMVEEATASSTSEISKTIHDIRDQVARTQDNSRRLTGLFTTVTEEVDSTIGAFSEIRRSLDALRGDFGRFRVDADEAVGAQPRPTALNR